MDWNYTILNYSFKLNWISFTTMQIHFFLRLLHHPFKVDCKTLVSTGSASSNSFTHEHQFYGATSSFTKIIMKTKYVCHGLISPYVSFQFNWIMWTIMIQFVKNCKWGGTKRAKMACRLNIKRHNKSIIIFTIKRHLGAHFHHPNLQILSINFIVYRGVYKGWDNDQTGSSLRY